MFLSNLCSFPVNDVNGLVHIVLNVLPLCATVVLLSALFLIMLSNSCGKPPQCEVHICSNILIVVNIFDSVP